MKLISLTVLFTLVLITNVQSQTPTDAAKRDVASKVTDVDEEVINLEQQYDTVVSQKKDGTHELYKYPDGTRVILVMKSGEPPSVSAVDKGGRPLQVVAVKRKRPCVVKPSPFNPGFTVGCGRRVIMRPTGPHYEDPKPKDYHPRRPGGK